MERLRNMKTNMIVNVRVDELYGLYSYVLPKDSIFSNATILYGDNGVGKSSLLRLVYHLLSSAGDRGHRGALYEIEFEFLEVQLSSGITVSARKINKNELNILRLDISNDGEILARWNYVKGESHRRSFEEEHQNAFFFERKNKERLVENEKYMTDEKEGIPTGKKIYMETLKKYSPVMFMLNADRHLDSDTVADPSDEVELRRQMHYDTPKSINQLVKRSREIGLTQAFSSASRWISQKAIIGTNLGSTNVHSVYMDVVNGIVSPSLNSKSEEEGNTSVNLIERLNIIEKKMREHAHYQLATELSTEKFIEAISLDEQQKSDLVAELLKPYIHSLERKLEAVEPTYEIIHDFITAINTFLNDKPASITGKIRSSVSIDNGSPSAL